MFDLTGKKAIVTGSTQGIGFAIAELLSKQGASVFVCGSSSAQKTEAAAAKINGAIPVTVDLLKADCADRMYEITGDVDILVLNASIQYKEKWNEFTMEQYDKMMDCNVRSSYLLIKKYAEGMKTRGWGRIVTVGSVNQYNQHPELSLYAVTKVAQMKMVQNFAAFLAPYGVTINNVAPGAIATPRNATIYEDDKLRHAVEAKIPCGRFGEPEDISPTVLLLCSNEGSYITGTDIVIDGGLQL